MKPYAHQQHLLDLSPDRWGLWWGTRTGKTNTAIWLANAKGAPFLVITKKHLVTQWKEECEQHATQSFDVLSKEHFKKRYDTLQPYRTVIYDEAHTVAGEQKHDRKKCTKTLAKCFADYLNRTDPPYRYLLTATPFTSTPWSIYRLASFLGHDWPYDKFRDTYFTQRKQRYRRCPKGRCVGCPMCERTIYEPRKDRASRLRDVAAASIGNSVKLSDCYDMPKEIYQDIDFPLLPIQKKEIENMTYGNSSSVNMAKHRIECGHVSGEGYEPDRFFPSPVNDYIIENHSQYEKVALVCRFRTHVAHLRQLMEAEGRKVFVLWGGMSDFHAVRKEAEESQNCVLIVQADCADGYSLKSFEAIIFASCSYSWVSYEQMLGRIRSIGRTTPCLYQFLTCGEIGKKVLENVRNKQNFNP